MYKICKTEESTARQRSVEQALQQMMLSKRIENISVRELCVAAGIPRNSFYRYFDSCEDVLYALIDHTLLDINEDAFLHWNGSPNLELSDLEHYFETWYHKREFLDALSKNGCSWLLVDRIEALMDKGKDTTSMSQNFARKQAWYIPTYATYAIMLRWHKHGFPDTPQAMAKVTFEMFSDSCISMGNSFL